MKVLSWVSLSLVALLLAGCGGRDESAQAEQKTDEVAQAQADTAAAGEAVKAATTSVADLDAHPGKALHDANCISCHDSAVYSREDRKIGDFPKLLAQVRRCDANLGSRLFDEDIEQVADYLNQAYYKFEQ
jgi:mono/diheme cytochrome c family protein